MEVVRGEIQRELFSATTGGDCCGGTHLSPHGNDNAPPLPNHESHHRNRSRIQSCASTHHLPTPLALKMGNKESASNDGVFSSPDRPSVLEVRDLRSVAKYMKSDKCKNVYVMVRSISPTTVHNAQGSAILSYLSRHRTVFGLQLSLSWELVRSPTPSFRCSPSSGLC